MPLIAAARGRRALAIGDRGVVRAGAGRLSDQAGPLLEELLTSVRKVLGEDAAAGDVVEEEGWGPGPSPILRSATASPMRELRWSHAAAGADRYEHPHHGRAGQVRSVVAWTIQLPGGQPSSGSGRVSGDRPHGRSRRTCLSRCCSGIASGKRPLGVRTMGLAAGRAHRGRSSSTRSGIFPHRYQSKLLPR